MVVEDHLTAIGLQDKILHDKGGSWLGHKSNIIPSNLFFFHSNSEKMLQEKRLKVCEKNETSEYNYNCLMYFSFHLFLMGFSSSL